MLDLEIYCQVNYGNIHYERLLPFNFVGQFILPYKKDL